MDTVSHLIRMAQLDARLDKRCLLGGSTRMDVAALGEREAPFHVLLEGSCTLEVGATRLELRQGDVVLIPSGAPHRILTPGRAASTGTRESPGDAFTTTRSSLDRVAVIDLFCGHYSFGGGVGAMLFGSLPDPLHVSFGHESGSADVLKTLSSLMRDEAHHDGDGTAAVLAALCTVILAMVLRTGPGLGRGTPLWTATTDVRIGPVIKRVLQDPGADWSIENLRGLAAMSRATFLRRFAQSTDMTAGAFVRQVRMMAAAHLLTTTDETVASVAAQVGYDSESAFSKAFRNATGATPARLRR